ncbi:hypothetical protein [Duganella radicis]|uniref:Uncharacterized protein n=1 Tax=Duganella radicis TaxID=551988 RepID=A0A6L6PSC3_9BURK|nr:hypothetical protein [Duganella radicis]MTV41940.1 hypothetical protein [Duganella radicis]
MLFYHYTSVPLAEAILTNGGINDGHLVRANGEIIKPVVWLTTSPSHEGHGLLTGKETYSEEDIAFLTRVEGEPPRNGITHNKTAMRIAVDLPENTPGLISFNDFCIQNEPPHFARRTGLTVFHKLKGMDTAAALARFKDTETMEDTWWVSADPVLQDRIVAVDFNSASGFVPYSFEDHGREPFLDAGFSVVSKESLATLNKIVMPGHKFDLVKAILLCDKPEREPIVLIRGANYFTAFIVKDGRPCFEREKGLDHAPVQAWIAENRSEILACWEEAVEVMYRYYPEKRIAGRQ